MIAFINPIEILDLSHLQFASIDDNVIKKAKKKLLAEIELSDDRHFNYKGLKITKSDCEKAIDELTSNDKKDYYYQLATTNQSLNNYLAIGDESFFDSIKQESIYQLTDFIDFINPIFANNFDRSLIKAFRNNNKSSLTSILRAKHLINQASINIAFKSVSNELKSRIDEIEILTNKVETKEIICSENTVKELLTGAKNKFNHEIINILPNYFQSQINKAADALNQLDVAIHKKYGITIYSMDLMTELMLLNIESVGKEQFKKNFEFTKQSYLEKIELEKNAPILKHWAKILSEIRELVDSVEEKTLTAQEAFEHTKTLFVLSELNNLPPFANEIRNQIGFAIRSLSISAWNKQDDIKTSITLIRYALQINVDAETNVKFKKDEKELKVLDEKLTCFFCDKNSVNDESKLMQKIYKVNSRGFRSVNYSYLDVEIPRCVECAAIHSKGKEASQTAAIIGGLIGAALGLFTGNGGGIFMFGLLGVLVGAGVGNLLKSSTIKKDGIKDLSDSSIRNHPLIQQKIKEGWTTYKPSA